MIVNATQGGAVALSVTVTLGVAMGLQAAAARTLAVADLTTVVPPTIVGLAADQLSTSRRSRQARRAVAFGAMLLGACCGALLLQVHMRVALVVTGVTPVVVAFIGAGTGLRPTRRWRIGTSGGVPKDTTPGFASHSP